MPTEAAINTAIANLQKMGVIDNHEKLTPLGQLMSQEQRSDVHESYMLALTKKLDGSGGKYQEAAAVFIALRTQWRSLRIDVPDKIKNVPNPEYANKIEKWKALGKGNTESDFAVMLNIWRTFSQFNLRTEQGEKQARQWAADNYLNYNALVAAGDELSKIRYKRTPAGERMNEIDDNLGKIIFGAFSDVRAEKAGQNLYKRPEYAADKLRIDAVSVVFGTEPNLIVFGNPGRVRVGKNMFVSMVHAGKPEWFEAPTAA